MIDIDVLLAWGAAYRKLIAGEIIFEEGQPGHFYYQLVSGKVRWYNLANDGKECIHSISGPGESFGELPLFDDRPYSASAIADENSIVIRLHKPTFLKLVKENSELLFAFTKLLSGRLRFKFAIVKAYGSHCPENIIATLLNNLKAEKKNFCYDCDQLDLTRQQIADMTGLRVETVIRTMRNMHDKGDLIISRGKVYYHDTIEVIKA